MRTASQEQRLSNLFHFARSIGLTPQESRGIASLVGRLLKQGATTHECEKYLVQAKNKHDPIRYLAAIARAHAKETLDNVG